MKVSSAVVLGLVLGLAVSLVPSCGGGAPSRCLASNCSGCCDAQLGCMPGDTPGACGLGGAACQPCADGRRCAAGQCVSGTGATGQDAGSCASSCPGCCTPSGACVAGTTAAACGRYGTPCAACGVNRTCDNGVCSLGACAGCRDSSGACLPGDAGTACGAGGAICQACGPSQTCFNGTCVTAGCGPLTCAGCCDGNECVASPSRSQCGAGGAACKACSFLESCVQGQCATPGLSCTPQSCGNGCCLDLELAKFCLPNDGGPGCTGGAACKADCFF